MSALADEMRAEMVRFLVQRQITCPLTGDVLDMDTCAVVWDRDSDPVGVYSPKVWQVITANPMIGDGFEEQGLTITSGRTVVP